MKKLSRLLLLFGILSLQASPLFFSLLFSQNSEAARTYTNENLPRQIAEAVRINLYLIENQIRNTLDGKTEGHLLAELQVDTQNRFNVYEENFKLDAPEGWNVSVLNTPKKIKFVDPVTKKLKSGYRGQTLFQVKVELNEKSKEQYGTHTQLPIGVHFQACNDELCLLPARLELPLAFVKDLTRVESRQNQETSWLEEKSSQLQNILDESALGFESFLLLLIAGLLTAFTPCVYPLYPITIGLFAKWTASSTGKTFLLSLVYGLGISMSYALVGLVAVSTGQLFGSLTQTPSFLIGMGLLILLSALFFSGLLPFQAPQFLQRIFGGSTGTDSPKALSKQIGQSFFMGSGLGVVAAPCVGPVIIALMAWLSGALAQSQEAYVQGALLLATFGFGMSLPLLVLANLIVGFKRQPQFGKWTPYFKHLGTVFMLAGSLFFLVPGFQLLTQSGQRYELSFPVESLETMSQEKWRVIDFRADWCAACHELEAETFSSKEVSALFSKETWEFVQVDLTENNEANTAISEKYNVIGLPTILFIDPEGKICKSHSLFGFEGPDKFIRRMEKARQDCR